MWMCLFKPKGTATLLIKKKKSPTKKQRKKNAFKKILDGRSGDGKMVFFLTYR
jgi:hypothetical protein